MSAEIESVAIGQVQLEGNYWCCGLALAIAFHRNFFRRSPYPYIYFSM